jgi:dimeric dUTPase (all-alpha-NTP-PPase superfamily)
MDKILQMIQLQQKLNDATSGVGWEKGLTNKGKRIDWKRCIYLEAAELIDSYPWKHWKNITAEPDFENIKIEIVDIWHFIMSEALRRYKIENKGSIENLSEQIKKLKHFSVFANDDSFFELDYYEQIAAVENMIGKLFCQDDLHQLIDAFMLMSAQLNLKLPELYQLYVGKNILNQFRQDHGYKEGNYIKKWNGVEDNVVMQSVLENHKDITPEQLYQLLEKQYPN